MDTNSLNVLVEAKKEYLKQLCALMVPIMIDTFHDMYKESVKMTNGKKVLIQYQKLMKEVPNWSDHMINTHNEKLCNSCSWFNDLLAAVFVSFVKILSSVRLKAENKKISVKLPSNQLFIHSCYINAAKDLYKDPYVYHDEPNEYERDTILKNRFKICVENTIDEMIPIQEILKSCMSQVTDKIDLESVADPEEDGLEDPDVDETFDEEPIEPVEPLEPTEPGPSDPSDEIKEINTGPPKPATTDEEEDVLFGDAPDEKKPE